MFNPNSEQHIEDCNCYLTPHSTNNDPPMSELQETATSYGERLRATTERVRLATNWAEELWRKGFRGRCLWYNVLGIYEPPDYEQSQVYIWKEIRENLP